MCDLAAQVFPGGKSEERKKGQAAQAAARLILILLRLILLRLLPALAWQRSPTRARRSFSVLQKAL